MNELPKIISVDDHVAEPAHVWQTWLPEKYREKGPHVERKRWGKFEHKAGAKYVNPEDPEGRWGDAWYFEDRLIYVHKRFVAIPLEATPDGDVTRFDRTKMVMEALTYDEMRPGCYQVEARIKDFELNWVDGSLPFPTFPRFCGQTFYEAEDKELGLACVKAYNDWMVEEWCAPSRGMNIPLCIMPLWDVELAAAEIQRNADRGVRAFCFSELPHHLKLPTIHSGGWDPVFQVCNDTGVTLCMHIGSSSTNPAASPDAPGGVGGTLAFNNSMASLADWLFSGKLIEFPKLKLAYSEGQIGWIPYALERADTVWDQHDSWQHSKERIPEPPSSYYYGRIFGCFTADHHGLHSLPEVGEDNICFETDYPHTDTTWPDSKAYVEKMLQGFDDKLAYKVLRGNAIKMLELDPGLTVPPEMKVHRSVTKGLKLFDADRLRWLDEAAAIGPLVGLRMGPVTTWVVTDAEAARTMLVPEGASWMRPPALAVPIRIGVGENLFTQSDKAWARLQPAVAPSFRKKALDARLDEIDAIVEDLVNAIPDTETVDLELAMGRIALTLAAWVMLGDHLDATRAEEIAHHQREVVGWVGRQLGKLNGFIPIALGSRAREMQRHRAVLGAYADEVIARAKAGDRGDDVLGALMSARPSGKALTPSQLRGHVLGLFLAGNETTAAALSWALVHGAAAPDDWARVRNEPSRYTLPFLTESLRLNPAVWGIPRVPNRAGVTLTVAGSTTRVRRGQVATIYLRGINRDANTWDDPLRFYPARHDDNDKQHARALLPFGLGPRGCIGQHLAMAELTAVLPALARRGDVAVDGPIGEDARFSLRVRGGLRGRFTNLERSAR